MARRRTPTAILEARGSRHAKTLGRSQEIDIPPAPKCPDPPEWLSSAAAPHWSAIAPMLFDRGLLTHIDTLKLGMLCDRLAHYIDLRERVQQDGWTTYNAEGGEASHPNVRAMQAAIKDIDTLAGRFGMSPTERSGLVLDKPKQGQIIKAKSKFAKG